MKTNLRIAALLVVAAALGVFAYIRLAPKPVEQAAAPVAEEPRSATGLRLPGARSILLRELPRQALALAAARVNGGHVDTHLVPRQKPDPSQPAVDAEWKVSGEFVVRLTRDGKAAGEFKMPLARGAGDMFPFDRVAEALAPLIEKGVFADAAQGGKASAPKAMAELPAPEGVEAMLTRVNYFDAFRAARLTHSAIATDGESPARLAALARAYANLGESTRPFLSTHFDVFFARALLYAERLVLARPNDANSYWTRAYVRSVIGLPSAAGDVKKAQSLAGTAPAWGEMVALFAAGDTVGLFDALPAAEKAGIGALTAHCAMRTVAFGGIEPVAIQFAGVAIAKDPTDFNAMMFANDNSGVGGLHRTTEMMPALINGGYAAIAAWPELPPAVKTAVTDASARQFDAPSRMKFWAALDAEPADGNPLPWATLAEFARETSLILADRRVAFVAEIWSVDPTDDFNAWWPVIKDHPAAGFVESYVHNVDPASLAKIDLDWTHERMWPLISGRGPSKPRIRAAGDTLLDRMPENIDLTTYDLAEFVWSYRRSVEGGGIKTDMARRLYAAAPADTVGLASMIQFDWPAVKSRKAELQAISAKAPHVGWRLGQRELTDGDADAAIKVLEEVVKTAPAGPVYDSLAGAYRAKGDIESLIRTLETFVKTGDDFSLDHAVALTTIAQELMQTGDAKRAVPYAAQAAESYSAAGLNSYAESLARAGDYAKAKSVFKAIEERYGASNRYQAFLISLLIPQMEDAQTTAWARGKLQAWSAPTARDDEKRRATVLFVHDEKLDDALREITSDGGSDGLIGLSTLASIQLMRGEEAAVMATLSRIDATPGDFNAAPHKAAARIARVVLNGDKPVMPNAALEFLNGVASDNSKATAAALVGLACERKGFKAEAEVWYRRAVRSTGIGPGRVIAARQLEKAELKVWP